MMPPIPPPFIENSLRSGQQFIKQDLDCLSLSAEAKHRHSQLVWLAELKSYLDEHDYVITLTDKNLGAAVVLWDWIEAGTVKLLSDINNYKIVDETQVDLAVNCICDAIIKLTTVHLPNDDWCMEEQNSQLAKFLQSKMPEDNTKLPEFTEFYAIQKIHKDPTGYWPIIPCYNNITEPASKVVSKMLKPLYPHYPMILNQGFSTKVTICNLMAGLKGLYSQLLSKHPRLIGQCQLY
jgi:hypothetical protein